MIYMNIAIVKLFAVNFVSNLCQNQDEAHNFRIWKC